MTNMKFDNVSGFHEDSYIRFTTDIIEDQLDEATLNFPELVQEYENLQDDFVSAWKKVNQKARRVEELELELAKTKLELADVKCSFDLESVSHLKLRLSMAEEANKYLIEVNNNYREHIIRTCTSRCPEFKKQDTNVRHDIGLYKKGTSGSSDGTEITKKTLQTSSTMNSSIESQCQGCLVLTDDKAYMVPIGSKSNSAHGIIHEDVAGVQRKDSNNTNDPIDEGSTENKSKNSKTFVDTFVGIEIPTYEIHHNLSDMISTTIEI